MEFATLIGTLGFILGVVAVLVFCVKRRDSVSWLSTIVRAAWNHKPWRIALLTGLSVFSISGLVLVILAPSLLRFTLGAALAVALVLVKLIPVLKDRTSYVNGSQASEPVLDAEQKKWIGWLYWSTLGIAILLTGIWLGGKFPGTPANQNLTAAFEGAVGAAIESTRHVRVLEARLALTQQGQDREKRRADESEAKFNAVAGELDEMRSAAKKLKPSIKLGFNGIPAEIPAYGSTAIKVKVARQDYEGPVDLEIDGGSIGIYHCEIPDQITVARAEDEVTLYIACNGRRGNENASGQIGITAYARNDERTSYKSSIPVSYNTKKK